MLGYENAGKGCVLFAMWVYSARFCGEVECRFGVLGDVRWGEGCGEWFLGEWGRIG